METLRYKKEAFLINIAVVSQYICIEVGRVTIMIFVDSLSRKKCLNEMNYYIVDIYDV